MHFLSTMFRVHSVPVSSLAQSEVLLTSYCDNFPYELKFQNCLLVYGRVPLVNLKCMHKRRKLQYCRIETYYRTYHFKLNDIARIRDQNQRYITEKKNSSKKKGTRAEL